MKETYKPYDTEEFLDYYFYRPLASIIVKITLNTSITPNHITWASLVFGLLAGFFFYYSDPIFLFAGIILLVISAILDCADGQLSRARGTGSMAGRMLDGFVDNTIFATIYTASVLKWHNQPFLGIEDFDPYGWKIWAIAVVASIGHSMQSSFFDYYRNEYISIAVKDYKSEAATPSDIKKEINNLSGVKGKFFDRFLLKLYYIYTKIQDKSNKKNTLKDRFNIPPNFADLYKQKNRILLRFWSVLGATAHLTYIMIFVTIDRMDLYLIFEAVFLNLYMMSLKLVQNRSMAQLVSPLTPLKNEQETQSPSQEPASIS